MKQFTKKLLGHPWTISFLAWLASWVLRLLWRTIRWTQVGAEHPAALVAAHQPFIVCFWHGRLMMLAFAWQWSSPFHMLISSHRDGRLIAQIVRHLNIATIAGSSSRQPTAAFRGMIATLRAGGVVGITPDGPRGPAGSIKEGILKAAYLAQVPIVPLTFSTSRGKFLGSWDRFLFVRPFGAGIIQWGAPLMPPPREADFDEGALTERLRQAMDHISKAADAAMGHL